MWDGTFRVCVVFVFGFVVFGCLVLFVWCFGVVFVWLFYELSQPHFLHTKVVELFTCLSGRALDLRVDPCLVALRILTSLNHGLPVS